MSIPYTTRSIVGVAVEHRSSRRYRPVARALFSWEGPDRLLRQGRGVIRDISDRGVYITGELTPPLGARMDVDVLLPLREAWSNAVQLHGEGTVVRIDRDAEQITGFAASVAFRAETVGGSSSVNPRRAN